MKYQAGDKLKVLIEIVRVDERDCDLPYYVSIGDNTCWLGEKAIEQAVLEADPEVKKAMLKQQIEALQKELEEMQ